MNLEEDLNCTICLDPSVSPIHCCFNGHIVCGICSDEIQTCGLCREELFKCGLAERLVQRYPMNLPCPNFDSGCKIPIKSTEMKDHLRLCEYRPILCFESLANVCGETFEMNKFVKHLISHHQTSTIQPNANGEYGWDWSSNLQNRTEAHPLNVLSFEKNGHAFLLHLLLDTTGFFWWITVLGGQAEADKYIYTTQLISPSNNAKVGWELPVLPFHEFNTYEKVVELGHYVSISYKMIIAGQGKLPPPDEMRLVPFAFRIETRSVS